MFLGDDVDDDEEADEALELADDFEFYRLQAEENAVLATAPPRPRTLPADSVDFSAESSTASESETETIHSTDRFDEEQQHFRTPHVSEGEIESGSDTEVEFIC